MYNDDVTYAFDDVTYTYDESTPWGGRSKSRVHEIWDATQFDSFKHCLVEFQVAANSFSHFKKEIPICQT